MLSKDYSKWDYREIEGKGFLFLTSKSCTQVMVWNKEMQAYGLYKDIDQFTKLYLKEGEELNLFRGCPR